MRSKVIVTLSALALLFAPLSMARAAVYAGNSCVASKQRAAAGFSLAALLAWSRWDRTHDTAKRDAALATAGQRLATLWTSAENVAARSNVNCADTTLSAAGTQALIENAVANIVASMNAGLDLNNKGQATCGSVVLTATGVDCLLNLNAESIYVTRLAAGKSKRDQSQTTARNRFLSGFTRTTARNCPTTATGPGLASQVDALVADLVTNTTVSPNVDNTQFTTIAPTGVVTYQRKQLTPLCSRDTPYYFFAKRGSVNKLVMYYQGGGACWDYQTCNLGVFDQNVDPNGGDNPNNQQAGFGDLSNPNNPFKDWNIVFTSYCTGDLHFGDVHQDYALDGSHVEHVNHFGYENSRVVEKWAREHFVNPDEVFVTGSSAGAYGAFFNAPVLQQVWPDSKFSVLADAGNGIITTSFIQGNFPSWNFEKNLPTNIPGLREAIQNGTGIPAYTKAVASYFPNIAWAHYATAYDGGTGGQTGFYNVMLNPSNILEWLNWWHASCQWHGVMRQQAVDTAAAITTGNYRYYIGRGSRHTAWGSNTVVYNDDAIGGTPALKDWTTSMRNRDAGWLNVECTDCETTLAGDPRPSPLQPPFQQVGPDVEIVCP